MQIPMVKVEIIGPKALLFKTLAILHRLGTLHIEDFSPDGASARLLTREMEMDEAQEKEKRLFESLIARINGVLSDLGVNGQIFSGAEQARTYRDLAAEKSPELLEKVAETVSKIEVPTAEMAKEKGVIDVEYWRIRKCEPVLEKIRPLASAIKTPEGFEFIAMIVDAAAREDLGKLRKDLEHITERQSDLFTMNMDDGTVAAILVYNRSFSAAVHRFLFQTNVDVLQLSDKLAGKPVADVYKSLKERLKVLKQEKKRLGKQLRQTAKEWSPRLVFLRQTLESRLDELQVVPKLGTTAYTFIISGWLPRQDISKVRKLLLDKVGEEVILSPLKVSADKWEEAPVALNNPSWARPFQLFYKLIKPPKYGTVDPTSFLAIFFPILFGLVVGDLGYGLVILAVALMIKRRLRGLVLAQVFASVALIASISAIFFGTFVFFEFFGDLGEQLVARFWGLHPPYSQILGVDWPIIRGDPETSFPILMIIALSVGVVHLSLGFLFGFVNGLRTHQRRHVYEKGGFLLVMIGLVLLALTNWAHVLPASINYLSAGLGVIAVVGIGWGGGVKAITEIFGTFANIISYSRLMALSLAGVIMANAINVLAAEMGSLGGAAIIAGAVLAIFLHAINIIICVLSPSIHSLRLHLVECFSKFYEPASVPYEPFKLGGENG